MGFVRRKDTSAADGAGSAKIFVPSADAFSRGEDGILPVPDAEPTVSVGIMRVERVLFSFDTDYVCVESGCHLPAGEYSASLSGDGEILFDDECYHELSFAPVGEQDYVSPMGAFALDGVTIGVGFHWERTEQQRFKGQLKLLADGDGMVVVNVVTVEAYLYSVISSEMSSLSSLELLKAHAVISRSWLLAPILNGGAKGRASFENVSDSEVTRWYGRDAHELFDVCADDHCQRYQGIARIQSENVREAVRLTVGQVLTYRGEVCDARFSKCCGGVTERFETCWDDTPHGDLSPLGDNVNASQIPDLTVEDNARRWILSSPEAFCNTTDERVIADVLNGYDRETADFYRWRVTYSQEELSFIVTERSGIDFGLVTDLIPLERGASGRIVRLKIVGTRHTVVVGKELEIRRWLSRSHLYSSAFVVDRAADGAFVLSGAGWGHGVGLCQIGAAVMGSRGYNYDEILLHYFPGASLTTLY